MSVERMYKLRWYHRYENVFFPGNGRVVASTGYIFSWTGKLVQWYIDHILKFPRIHSGENRRIER